MEILSGISIFLAESWFSVRFRHAIFWGPVENSRGLHIQISIVAKLIFREENIELSCRNSIFPVVVEVEIFNSFANGGSYNNCLNIPQGQAPGSGQPWQ